jgi:hypothetical protein
VLERRHRARIHVDVGIELDVGDPDAARFEDRGERGGGYALPQTGDDTAGYKNVLRHERRVWREWTSLQETGRALKAPCSLPRLSMIAAFSAL